MKRVCVAVPGMIASMLAFGCGAESEDPAFRDDASGVLAQETAPSDGVDLVGTWFAVVKTKADIRAPIVGVSSSDVDLALKLYVTRSGGQLSADVSLCNLATNSPNLVLGFDRVEKFIKLTKSIPDFTATVGGKVPLPDVLFQIGQDAAGNAVDLEGDGNPGATVGAVALGLVPLDAYVGLNLNIKLDAVLSDPQTVSGSATFTGDGKVFGSNFPLLTSGFITVTQTQTPTTVSVKHSEGDVPCETLLAAAQPPAATPPATTPPASK